MIDTGIIENFIKGDLDNFPEIVDSLSPFAFSTALRMLGDEDEADDIVQESMITVWQKIGRLKNPEGFKSWFYRIVINKCYDRLRKIKRNPETCCDERIWGVLSDRITEDPSVSLENNEICFIVNALTMKLSPKQKAVFVLSDLEEMSQEEISSITGISRSSVKSNLHHARKKIGEQLKKYM